MPPPPLKSQDRYVNPLDPTAYPSISAALSGPPASGTIIRVQGITHNGQPTGYSNSPVIPGQAPEAFPLQLPAGVSIVAATGSAPVYIYATVPTATLLALTYGGAGSGSVSSLEDLSFLGSDLAVQLSGNASITKSVQLDSCTFVRNQIGISCIESGAGTMNLLVSECILSPTIPSGLTPPAATTPPGIGIQLHAIEATPGQVPVILAEVGELLASPGYGLTHEFPTVGNEPPDLAFRTLGSNGLGDFSRIIEVYATGSSLDHGVPGRIAEVILDVNGGTLESTPADWMVGIYATAEGAGKSGAQDYTAGYDITVTGSTLTDLAVCGAYVTSFRYGRGLITFQGGTSVLGTTSGTARAPGDYLQSGVHGFNYDGYLGIQGVNAQFLANTGHGIYLAGLNTNVRAQEPLHAIELIGPYPTGAYLRLFKCDLHGNGGSGVMVTSGLDQFNPNYSLGPDGPSISGGTWYESLPNILDLRERSGFELPNGPGLIDRCRISNNGEHGVFALAYGKTNTVTTPQPATVSMHLVNNMIWSNPMGGFTALLSDSSGPGDPYDHGPTLLVPVVQCTLVANGSSQLDPNLPTQPSAVPADWSLEVYEDVNWRGLCRYEWHYNPFAPGTPGEYLLTRVFNSILQRRIPDDPLLLDFGPVIEGGLGVPDAADPNQLHDGLLGIAGVRARALSPGIQGSAEWVATDAASVFQGPIDLSLHDATQFLLTSFGPSNHFGNTPSWVWTFITAGQHDYSGNQRQQPIMNPHPSPEKGSDEYQ